MTDSLWLHDLPILLMALVFAWFFAPMLRQKGTRPKDDEEPETSRPPKDAEGASGFIVKGFFVMCLLLAVALGLHWGFGLPPAWIAYTAGAVLVLALLRPASFLKAVRSAWRRRRR